jgi:hypothetical protein
MLSMHDLPVLSDLLLEDGVSPAIVRAVADGLPERLVCSEVRCLRCGQRAPRRAIGLGPRGCPAGLI